MQSITKRTAADSAANSQSRPEAPSLSDHVGKWPGAFALARITF
jgi:hypothetical protein